MRPSRQARAAKNKKGGVALHSTLESPDIEPSPQSLRLGVSFPAR